MMIHGFSYEGCADCIFWLRSVTLKIAIALPTQATGEAQRCFVTNSKSAMTKSIEEVFRRKSTGACKNHIVEHIRMK
jgi:hypothetical protein